MPTCPRRRLPIRVGLAAIGLLGSLGLSSMAAAADWPGFRGAERDGRSPETITDTWPAEGPRELWRRTIGGGFSGMAVVGDRLYTMWLEDGAEHLVALDADTGRELWRLRAGDAFENERGDGPRATPAVADGRVYALSGRGRLHAVDAATGETVWSRDLVAEMGARIPIWGVSASPLVEGDLLVVQVGGDPGKAIAAFDRASGEVAWTAFTDEPSYSSPIALDLAGRRQVVTVTGSHVVGVSLRGEVLWSEPWEVVNQIHVATPVELPDDRVFVSSSYDVGSLALDVEAGAGGGAVEAREAWRSRVMKNHFQTSVRRDGFLVGFDNATLEGITFEGEELWRHRGFGKGWLLATEEHLLVLAERCRLALAEATPEAFVEIASTQALEGRCWTPPSLAGGRLFVRNESEMVAYDVGERGATEDDGAAERDEEGAR